MLQRPRKRAATAAGAVRSGQGRVARADRHGGGDGWREWRQTKRRSGGLPFCLPPRVAKSPAGQAASAGCPAAVSPAV
ncbi:hypothetical protein AQ932_01725 [Burkholderia pseudomallei]|nr:hypothetical protein AQ854_02355 [Burkholderia pseudomallei]OMY96144.1 hypothetical protein AQ856_11000 [Burkholderia pseudomallei]OMY98777.1 hypothetical protein AQ855_09520 [Burkholderia pseudomallei]OMZ96354.1 hypothetical protein AQ870_24655 [Burkholderia pseudomallei]OND26341.1 hypothetical protein AQ931_24045 [Burkholderia pseudomallei]